jgi:hypothetical protein
MDTGEAMTDELEVEQIRAICQALGYSLWDEAKSFPEVRREPTMIEKNMVVEFWHALNRNTPNRDKIVANGNVDNAIAHTLAWLKWYWRELHLPNDFRQPNPEWGKEYR